ncbi:unnamed protein product [Prunus armeniaca]
MEEKYQSKLDESNSQLQTVLVTDAATHLSCSSSAHKDCKCVSKHVMQQWAVCWNEVTYQPDETSVCSYYMGLFLVDPQYGAACGVKDWSIQNPLHVKELSQTSAGGFLSSISLRGPMNSIFKSAADTHQAVNGSHEIEENRNGTVNVVDLQHQDGDVDRKLDSKPSFKRSSSSNKNDETKILLICHQMQGPCLHVEEGLAEEPLGHAAAIITDVLENAETNHVISAVQKRALFQEMALRLT